MKTKNACILLLAALTMTACEYDDSALWEQVNQNTERIAAPVPQLSTGSSLTTQGVTQDAEGNAIDPEAIYLSVDGGETWTRVSGTDGDSFFRKVDTSDPTCVTFTLADGTTFSVPRYTGIKVDFGDATEVYLDYGTTETVNFTAEGSDQFTADNLFIIAPYGWKAEVTLPTRAATDFILTVTAPADATSGAAEGEILVMLDNGQGSTTIGRLTVTVKYIIDGTTLTAHNPEAGKLAELIGELSNLTSITVTSGTLNETDWAAVVKNNAALLYLDLEGATYEGTDKDNLAYNNNRVNSLPLLTIQLPQGITGLGEYAFNYCTSLTSIDLPEGVTSIGNNAFTNCKALTSIDLPEGVKTIGNDTFRNCSSLTSIDLPETLTSIGDYAFSGCAALPSITLPETLTSIGEYTFRNCSSLTSIDLPETLTSIGDYAFQYCTGLESITLPDKVTSIGKGVFENCTSLTSITLPEGVTSIEYTFRYCSSLTSITLPSTMESIGNVVFYGCNTPLTITCLATEVPDLGDYAFDNCWISRIYVPAESVEAYRKAENWSKYPGLIFAIQEAS